MYWKKHELITGILQINFADTKFEQAEIIQQKWLVGEKKRLVEIVAVTKEIKFCETIA